MREIDNYLEALYKNDKTKEIIELKEEMREHLIESVNDLKKEGYKENEAIKIAISRFDGGSDMEKDLDYMILSKSKKFLNLSRNLFILSVVVAIVSFLAYKNEYSKVQSISDNVEEVVREIALTKDITNPKTYKEELDKTMKSKEFKKVTYLYIHNGVTDKTYSTKDGVETFDSKGLKQQYKYSNDTFYNSAYGDGGLTKNTSGEKLYYSTAVVYNGSSLYLFFIFAVIICVFTLTIYVYNLISFKNKRKLA